MEIIPETETVVNVIDVVETEIVRETLIIPEIETVTEVETEVNIINVIETEIVEEIKTVIEVE